MMKLIKTKQDHELALKRIETLLADSSSQEAMDELELLAHLVDQYEEKEFPIDFPSPVAAIKFRMDQLGLKQKDLVSYIGSKSKVSEVLNGKRPITLEMMRKLNSGLGIPAEILLQSPKAELPKTYTDLNWEQFPLRELVKRGIVEGKNIKERAEEAMRGLIHAAGSPPLANACFRQGSWNGKTADCYATLAWELIVRARARKVELSTKYTQGSFTEAHMEKLAHLSIYTDGPKLAVEYLARHGIILLIEPAIKGTYLDGIALLLEDGTPVVGLTLRLDRIDYFWFTLMHELAHIIKHVTPEQSSIIDFKDGSSAKDTEDEADTIASNALIPDKQWVKSKAKQRGSKAGVLELAEQLEIHEAIVAGRVRKERNNYRILSGLVGQKQIRKLFW